MPELHVEAWWVLFRSKEDRRRASILNNCFLVRRSDIASVHVHVHVYVRRT
jgi:hypothetical protein